MRFALLAALLPACMNSPEEARASYTDDEGDVVVEMSDPFNLGCAATVNRCRLGSSGSAKIFPKGNRASGFC